jgi:hypothetical protein
MPKSHPHDEASYRVIPFDGGRFAVEVSIPGSHPTKVSPFATEADAEAWIAKHLIQVQTQSQSGRWFRRAGSR